MMFLFLQLVFWLLIAGILGFEPMTYFKSEAGSEKAPDVNFDFN